MKSEIVSQTPGWYILLCLGWGIALAVLYYVRASVFTRNQKRLLALLRGVLGFLVAFLLLNPLIKTVSSLILKPKVVVLVDNSRSMRSGGNLKEAGAGLEALRKDIEKKGYEFEIRNLDDLPVTGFTPDAFQARKTNLSAGMNAIRNNYEGQNLSDVILFSDGIMNDGVSPTFQKYPFRVHTVGFGDSTLKRDAFIAGVSANRLAYLGNNFTVSLDVGSYLMKGKTARVEILDSEGKVLENRTTGYGTDETFESISFTLPAKAVGKQRYIARLQVLEGEHSEKNNRREFVVDVVNGKEKILLLASAPHPDIKALKSIIEKNDLFELNVKIVQDSDAAAVQNEVFDVLILHQFPDAAQLHTRFLGALLARQKPVFFIPGSRSDLSYFNGMQNIVGIQAQPGKLDKVTSQVNSSFSLFTIGQNQAALIADLPPLTVPFGNYTLHTGSDVILGQYVSGINTSRPLLAVNLTGTRKMAAFLGDGLWQWRLEEFAMTGAHESLDDLLLKTLQLISVREEKGKLRVYPVADVFEADQRVSFVAEVYNEIFERIFDQNIRLKIKPQGGAEKVYDFTISEGMSRFELSALPPGVYTYEASAKVQGKDEVSGGQFVVSDTDLETQNTTADFSLLRTLARENGGDFVDAAHIFELRNSLEEKGLINRVVAQEDLKDLINLRWLLALILAFATVEWVLRKYFGSY
ncbi:VWA domain-containing protein [Leadbetterella sp. DM7]|uniref:VWA domain-containing protein n=1 Tax=Leadbetterella sp. DM7 TaxID=3235085 RepID=UPI00349ED27D